MLDSSYDSISLANALNKKVIEAGIPHQGDLETESKTRNHMLALIEDYKMRTNNFKNQFSQGGKTI